MDKLDIGNISPVKFNPLPKIISIHDAKLASEFHKRLAEYVIDFEDSLKEDEEVAIKLVSFGESITMYVDDIGYYNPSLISFTGTLGGGERVQLIQNVNQISFLLMAAKTQKPKEERNKVGYKLKHELEEEAKKEQ